MIAGKAEKNHVTLTNPKVCTYIIQKVERVQYKTTTQQTTTKTRDGN